MYRTGGKKKLLENILKAAPIFSGPAAVLRSFWEAAAALDEIELPSFFLQGKVMFAYWIRLLKGRFTGKRWTSLSILLACWL